MEFEGKITRADIEAAKGLVESKEQLKWEKLGTVNVKGHDVVIHRQPVEGGLYQYYAYGTLPLSSRELADINFDVEYRKEWDSYAKEIRVVGEEHHDETHQEQTYWEVAFPWPMSNRDYVFQRHRSQHRLGEEDKQHHILISKGSSHPELPEKSGVVRVEKLLNLMLLSDVDEDRCEFKMLYFDDLRGSIPNWLTNWAVSKAVPAFLVSLVDAANKRKKEKEEGSK